jgi:hypothetical protein
MPLIFALILVGATVLPFLWEHIFDATLNETKAPNIGQLAFIACAPWAATFSLFFITEIWPQPEILIGVIIFIIVLSTMTWGYAMYYREKMRKWLWLIMSFCTLFLYPALFFILIISTGF